ncbi:exported hypothetical protein [Staphylococcus argenteus]|uniref:Uncharacterized protein n=1 Tax=Staphylococcus argenteus TaxID=985002 RepID=A0A7U7PXB9_9STAP|nr:exported hypothetical protein [Staphylococcus argenteus]CRI22278.1 exported hypothetical protein [Staphylococcus argenteus]
MKYLKQCINKLLTILGCLTATSSDANRYMILCGCKVLHES